MPKTVACIIARTVSTRLPLKVLRTVSDHLSMLDFMITRLKTVEEIDEIYLCTSSESPDDILEDVAAKNGIKIYRGSASEVIERMLSVAKITKADNVIRITGDNVFTSHEYIGQQIQILNEQNLDYIRVVDVPIGATAEVMKVSALEDCYNSIDPAISEYLLLFMFDPGKYKCGVIRISEADHSNFTITVDMPEDLVRSKEILKRYEGPALTIKLHDIIQILQNHDIANCVFEAAGLVKLPYNKTIPYSEFKADMDNRVAQSFQFEIYA